jgi:hypothetical protein
MSEYPPDPSTWPESEVEQLNVPEAAELLKKRWRLLEKWFNHLPASTDARVAAEIPGTDQTAHLLLKRAKNRWTLFGEVTQANEEPSGFADVQALPLWKMGACWAAIPPLVEEARSAVRHRRAEVLDHIKRFDGVIHELGLVNEIRELEGK